MRTTQSKSLIRRRRRNLVKKQRLRIYGDREETALKKICGAVIVLILSLMNAGAETRKTLVIGNDSYPGNSLINARNDARAIGEALSALGYKATVDLDLDRKGMIDAIERFDDSIQPGDTVVLYYAGHG